MRLRALVSLLVLTSADYVLWDWSIADGHDIVSLCAGLTLLPLAAVTLGGLVLTGARMLRLVLGASSRHARAERASRGTSASERTTHTSAAQPDRSSGRLAA